MAMVESVPNAVAGLMHRQGETALPSLNAGIASYAAALKA